MFSIFFNKRRLWRKIVILFFVLYVIFLICLVISLRLPKLELSKNLISCYTPANDWINDSNEILLPDILDAKPKLNLNDNIFFVDSSCCKNNERQMAELNVQQACAVESAALHHKDNQVIVLFVRPVYKSEESSLTQALSSYKNVHFYNVNLWRFLIGSTVEELLNNDNLHYAHFLTEHVSSLMRLMTLWRWGGVYMNFDTLTLGNMMRLPQNTVAWETSRGVIGSSVLKFSANGTGHDILEAVLHDFKQLLDHSTRRVDVSELLTNILNFHCFLETERDGFQECKGVFILPKHVFYGIPLHEWHQMFMKVHAMQLVQRLKDAHVITTWGHVDNQYMKGKESTAFGMFAATNCPHIFNIAMKNSSNNTKIY